MVGPRPWLDQVATVTEAVGTMTSTSVVAAASVFAVRAVLALAVPAALIFIFRRFWTRIGTCFRAVPGV